MIASVQINEWGRGWDLPASGLSFSPLQKRLVQLEEAGKTVQEIADESRLSLRTVQIQLAEIHSRMASVARRQQMNQS